MSSFSQFWKQSGKGKKKKRLKKRNASDDYAGAAIGASILQKKSNRGEVNFKEGNTMIQHTKDKEIPDSDERQTVVKNKSLQSVC